MRKTKLLAELLLKMIGLFVLIGALTFLPAGTLRYWQAWTYLAVFFVPSLAVSIYFSFADPEFIERRMRRQEREPVQRVVMFAISVLYFGCYALSGFDHRFDWSDVPTSLVLASDATILLGYVLMYRVFKENRYASSVIEVEPNQRVVSTGPYALIRHPLYLGGLPMLVLIPLALGSYWGLLATAPLPTLLIARILNEEKVLLRDLPGYADYCRRVCYRLLPSVW